MKYLSVYKEIRAKGFKYKTKNMEMKISVVSTSQLCAYSSAIINIRIN
jgi:hypothetical protein